LARVEGRPIRAHEVDAGLAISLHDLALARYRLREQRLREIVERRRSVGEPASAREPEILLEPPPAPRLSLPLAGARMRGPEHAPVTLVEFIDFQSTPSRTLQPLLEKLLDGYPDLVRLAVRDLPMPYHRRARAAAEAARCAGEQDAYWAYHATLLQEQPQLEAEHLADYARRLGLDPSEFEACLGEERHAGAVSADAALAGLLGIPRAPTLFANGLYLPPPLDYAALEEIVLSEAGRSASPQAHPAKGPVPGTNRSLPQGDGPALPGALPPVFGEDLIEPEAVLDIPPSVARRALAERPELEARLETSSGTFSGRRLLKVRSVGSGDLYDRFGLQPDDVLLLVGEEWVTADGNPLWKALESQDEITLLIMRQGLPHRFQYRFR